MKHFGKMMTRSLGSSLSVCLSATLTLQPTIATAQTVKTPAPEKPGSGAPPMPHPISPTVRAPSRFCTIQEKDAYLKLVEEQLRAIDAVAQVARDYLSTMRAYINDEQKTATAEDIQRDEQDLTLFQKNYLDEMTITDPKEAQNIVDAVKKAPVVDCSTQEAVEFLRPALKPMYIPALPVKPCTQAEIDAVIAKAKAAASAAADNVIAGRRYIAELARQISYYAESARGLATRLRQEKKTYEETVGRDSKEKFDAALARFNSALSLRPVQCEEKIDDAPPPQIAPPPAPESGTPPPPAVAPTPEPVPPPAPPVASPSPAPPAAPASPNAAPTPSPHAGLPQENGPSQLAAGHFAGSLGVDYSFFFPNLGNDGRQFRIGATGIVGITDNLGIQGSLSYSSVATGGPHLDNWNISGGIDFHVPGVGPTELTLAPIIGYQQTHQGGFESKTIDYGAATRLRLSPSGIVIFADAGGFSTNSDFCSGSSCSSSDSNGFFAGGGATFYPTDNFSITPSIDYTHFDPFGGSEEFDYSLKGVHKLGPVDIVLEYDHSDFAPGNFHVNTVSIGITIPLGFHAGAPLKIAEDFRPLHAELSPLYFRF